MKGEGEDSGQGGGGGGKYQPSERFKSSSFSMAIDLSGVCMQFRFRAENRRDLETGEMFSGLENRG